MCESSCPLASLPFQTLRQSQLDLTLLSKLVRGRSLDLTARLNRNLNADMRQHLNLSTLHCPKINLKASICWEKDQDPECRRQLTARSHMMKSCFRPTTWHKAVAHSRPKKHHESINKGLAQQATLLIRRLATMPEQLSQPCCLKTLSKTAHHLCSKKDRRSGSRRAPGPCRRMSV